MLFCVAWLLRKAGVLQGRQRRHFCCFKGVNAENCQQAQVPFLYCLGAVAYRPDVKQVQGHYQFNGRAGGGRQGMREVGASARLS